jgi:hypothetical protein
VNTNLLDRDVHGVIAAGRRIGERYAQCAIRCTRESDIAAITTTTAAGRKSRQHQGAQHQFQVEG